MFVGINSPGTVTVQNGAVGRRGWGSPGLLHWRRHPALYSTVNRIEMDLYVGGCCWCMPGLDHNSQRGLFTSANGTQIGLLSGINGSVTIDGPGSEWTYTQGIAVGSGGNGVVIVQNGGVLSGDGGQLGVSDNGATGMVTVTDAWLAMDQHWGCVTDLNGQGQGGQGNLTLNSVARVVRMPY